MDNDKKAFEKICKQTLSLPENWMHGSISQHFDKAIDKAMKQDDTTPTTTK